MLFIAAKTASLHVSNILGKLGVATRGEAAATAYHEGLTDPAPSPRHPGLTRPARAGPEGAMTRLTGRRAEESRCS
jgi:hypothetical protein